jgi:hypothetical protein
MFVVCVVELRGIEPLASALRISPGAKYPKSASTCKNTLCHLPAALGFRLTILNIRQQQKTNFYKLAIPISYPFAIFAFLDPVC